MRQLLVCILISLLLLPALGQEERRYSDDFAWDVLSRRDVRRLTRTRLNLRDEAKSAEPLLPVKEQPFEDLAPAKNTGTRQVSLPSQWVLPPWPGLAPALPDDLPEEVRAQMQAEAAAIAGPQPDAFNGLEPIGAAPKVDVRNRPRKVYIDEQVRPKKLVTPTPFSLRRYSDGNGPFFQIALYGGTTSFAAETAYLALRAGADERQPLEGIGKKAFLTQVLLGLPDPDDEEEEPEEPLRPKARKPKGPPLRAIEVIGPQRPDMLDPGLHAAHDAPAFNSIPTDVTSRTPEKAAYRPERKVYKYEKALPTHEVLVLVAYFPEQAVTVELALDKRIGHFQQLVSLGQIAQYRLATRD